MNTKRTILVGAHRGAMCHAPENSIAAFETAIAMGAYRVEFDVRRSRDGQIVVMHDETVDRTTDGTGRVADLTLEELRRLRLGGSATETVPTLDETLACAKGRTRLLVEIKAAGLAEDVADRIEAAGMADACTVASFHEDELSRVRAYAAGRVATAYFLTDPERTASFDVRAVIERLGISLLVVWPRAATAEVVGAAKRAGLHVRCGLRDDLSYEETGALFARMADMGVDEIACGRPDWIARLAQAYAATVSRMNEQPGMVA